MVWIASVPRPTVPVAVRLVNVPAAAVLAPMMEASMDVLSISPPSMVRSSSTSASLTTLEAATKSEAVPTVMALWSM